MANEAATPGRVDEKKAGVQEVYKVIHKSSGAVGGYGHDGPIYGEVTMGTFQKVVEYLRKHLEFGSDSCFLDIGAGLGKPNLHVAVDPGVEYSFGIEIEDLRWKLSMHNLRHCHKQCPSLQQVEATHNHPNVHFIHSDVTAIDHFSPFTHIYMFDVGFPPDVLVKIANAFNISRSVKGLVSFQTPKRMIEHYGFDMSLMEKIKTRMCGSSESHTAYVYRSNHYRPKHSSTDQLKVSAVEPSSIASRAKCRIRSPVKQKRRQQLQLDTLFPSAKRQKSRTTSKIGADTEKEEEMPTTPPRELFPSIPHENYCPDPVFQSGFLMLNDPESAHTQTPQKLKGDLVPSSPYKKWLMSSGLIEGQCRPRRSPAKRVLYA